MIRKHNRFSKPRKLYNKARIEDEGKIQEKYGLKNKREIWKADFQVAKIREKVKKNLTSDTEKQGKIIESINRKGFKIKDITEALSLTKEDWLKRRLQTILAEKFHIKPKHARQMITHKHIKVNGRIVNVPSYIVELDEENKIEIIKSKRIEEIKQPKGKE